MSLTDLIPEEQKIKYMMRKILERANVEIRAQDIIVEKDLYRPDKYIVKVAKPAENP